MADVVSNRSNQVIFTGTVKECEVFIESLMLNDFDGVISGEYTIDCTEDEEKEYQYVGYCF